MIRSDSRRPRRRSAVLLSGAILAGSAVSTSAQPAPEPEQVVLGERHALYSEILGESRPILVHTPDGYVPGGSARYPVLYLLDGDAHFLHVAGVADFLADNRRMPRVLVVAVPNLSRDTRTRDLTPEPGTDFEFQGRPAREAFPTAGGADPFLRFLRDELAPWVEARYAVAPFRVLIGHSFGGLFNIHALHTDPDAFGAHIAISPSLWWDGRTELEDMRPLLEGGAGRTFLYMTLGNEGGMMLEGVQALAAALESAPASFAWVFDHKPAETHNSVPHRSIYDGLEWLFSAWDITPAEFVGVTGGDRLGRVDARFHELSEHYGYAIATPEAFLNALGAALLSAGDVPGAVEVLEAAVDRYPESPAVYDRVGDAYDAAGDAERAEASYREAWTRARAMGHPEAAVYKEHLDRVTSRRPRERRSTEASSSTRRRDGPPPPGDTD